MRILKFTLSGKNAFFKKPEVNSYYYFSYGHIHKVAILGIFGAILGLKGYSQLGKDDVFPEFYDKLKELKISVATKTKNGYIHKKIQSFNNSVGYASREMGGNLIVREQWLENPCWDIYVMIDSEIAEELSESILNNRCVYVPYLGKNDHFADLLEISLIEGVSVGDKVGVIDSFFPKQSTILDDDDDEVDFPFKYEEFLPIALDPEMNLYVLEPFIYTNIPVEKTNCEIICVGGKNIIFY